MHADSYITAHIHTQPLPQTKFEFSPCRSHALLIRDCDHRILQNSGKTLRELLGLFCIRSFARFVRSIIAYRFIYLFVCLFIRIGRTAHTVVVFIIVLSLSTSS